MLPTTCATNTSGTAGYRHEISGNALAPAACWATRKIKRGSTESQTNPVSFSLQPMRVATTGDTEDQSQAPEHFVLVKILDLTRVLPPGG